VLSALKKMIVIYDAQVHMSVQILVNQEFLKCVTCIEIENLKSDIDEFNNILGIANRQAAKEAIRTEINVLLAKIESIKAPTQDRQKNEASWSEIVKGRKKPGLTVGQPIPVLRNRFQTLSNLNDCDLKGCPLMYEQKREKCDKLIEKQRLLKKKILIVGDSHTKGIATELQHKLNKNYVVQGIVKSGADLEVMVHSNMKQCKNLTKKDTLIIWGGTKEVSRNEAQKGLSNIRTFIQRNLNMNVIVLSLPQRMDLEDQSCLNKEVKNFNRKLDKHLKLLECAHYIEINYDRKHHTRHSLYLNAKVRSV
jgi:hypothetical protein